MAYLTAIVNILKFLPELVKLVKWINEQVVAGIEAHQIKKALESITKSFNNPNRREAAGDLNDVFRK